MPTEIKNTKEFNDSINGSNLTVVHFSAKWAEQCQHLNDVLDELAKQNELKTSGVQFCMCEAEDLADISLKYKIEAAPTILLFRHGNAIDRVDGADAAQLSAKVKKHAGTITPDTSTKSSVPLEVRLKQLINQHNVMLFIKGNREAPKCGFSRKIIDIINDSGVEYGTFDILTDEEVRQGLKTFSDWPTYPQLYVKGELMGGLDIVKEMQASGDLASTLQV